MTRRSLHIVHTEASCGWGGQEIRILTEAAGMIARGHRVTLLCPREARIFEEAPRFGVPVEAMPIGKKRLGGVLALRRWLKQNAVDVINTHSSTDSWLAALARLGLSQSPALVRTRHISAPVSNNWSTRWLYQRGTDRVVTTGERLRETLIQQNGLPPDHVLSIATGIDSDRFQPGSRDHARAQLGLTQEATYIGIVATLRSWKGHLFLFEALAQLKDRLELSILVVGDGPYRPTLEQRVASLGLDGRVRFVGQQQDVLPWLRAADLIALPSYANEGVPQALLQAMFCAKPIVSTRVGSIDEIIRDGETGLLIPPKDAGALATAIARLLDDAALRGRVAEAARAMAMSNYTLNHMVARMEAVFEAAVAARSGKVVR